MAKLDLLDTTSEWDYTKPWCTVEERNNAVNQLLRNPNLDHVALYELMANNFALSCQLLFVTHDPRRSPAKMPFKLWPYEIKLGDCLTWALSNCSDLYGEKSRDMGVSWVVAAWLLHNWIWRDDFHALITSRKKELIDSRNEPDTLFERMRMMLEGMPERFRQMLLPNFDKKHHATYSKLYNPIQGNSITGEPPVTTFGRAGRYTVIVYDEAAFMEKLRQMRASAGDASNTHIYITTPNGMQGEWWSMRQNAIKNGFPPIVTVHWSSHPIKGQGLYEVEDHGQEAALAKLREVFEGKE